MTYPVYPTYVALAMGGLVANSILAQEEHAVVHDPPMPPSAKTRARASLRFFAPLLVLVAAATLPGVPAFARCAYAVVALVQIGMSGVLSTQRATMQGVAEGFSNVPLREKMLSLSGIKSLQKRRDNFARRITSINRSITELRETYKDFEEFGAKRHGKDRNDHGGVDDDDEEGEENEEDEKGFSYQ